MASHPVPIFHDFSDSRHSSLQHFDGAQLSRNLEVVSSQQLILDPNQAMDPVREWQVLEEAAKNGEFQMGVRV